MLRKSITFKLIAIVLAALAATTAGVLIAADRLLTGIIDRSQEAVYTEKLDAVWGILDRRHELLQKTGLEEVYRHDFQEAALDAVRRSHYRRQDRSVAPFIVDAGGRIVIHPSLPRGDLSLNGSDILENMLAADRGSFEYRRDDGAYWCIFKHFDPWGWVFGYAVPLKVKYRNVRQFNRILLFLMAGITALTMTVVSVIVARFTRPIVRLTEAAALIADGGKAPPIEAGGTDEVGTLAASFMRMRDAVDARIAELQAERNRAANILEGTDAGTWDWDIRTGEVAINERWAEITGHDRDELLPLDVEKWRAGIHPDDLPLVSDALERHFAGTPAYFDVEYRQRRRKGGWTWISSRGKVVERSETGRPLRMSGIHLDITRRRRSEQELRRLQSYLSNIIDSMPSVLIGVAPDGKVTQWNRSAEKTTGIAKDAALGRNLCDVFPRMAPEAPKISGSIQTRSIRTERKRPESSEGDAPFEDVTIYPLIANGVEGAVIRIDDVTEKVRMEEMMIQSEKMLSVGGLAAGMAHEINNPLSGVLQTADVVRMRLTDNVNNPANLRAAEAAGTDMDRILRFMEQRGIPRMLDNLNEAGRRIAGIVDNMLSFARKSDDLKSSHDLARLVDRTLELASADYDLKKKYDFRTIRIKKDYDENLPPVPCEGSKIQQVLLNILQNGAQAMHGAGTENPQFTIRIRSPETRDAVRIEISDNGPGMDEATRRRVFEPFYTTKPLGEGTGLGLSVSYFIVTENHGGTLAVASRPGEGATFTVTLPLLRTKGETGA